jgi:hypothetical protein
MNPFPEDDRNGPPDPTPGRRAGKRAFLSMARRRQESARIRKETVEAQRAAGFKPARLRLVQLPVPDWSRPVGQTRALGVDRKRPGWAKKRDRRRAARLGK